MPDETKQDAPRIAPEFRNDSLTAISVIVGFSLSLLSRWAGTPGKWHSADLFAVALIVVGTAAQTWSLGAMLFVSSMVTANLATPYLCNVSAIPLRSKFTISPIWLPVSSRIAPFWLVSTIACGPRPMVAPAPPAA